METITPQDLRDAAILKYLAWAMSDMVYVSTAIKALSDRAEKIERGEYKLKIDPFINRAILKP
jgi:hypothetical protein